ncbi:putative ATP-dependent endonuclease of OLD family [Chitinophaga dinghuensis]|uniref:Putative ATP-dependent endonuclease of OLD family n=1 Tax=Chitinophaga dinghuensis TaxID=1539050 RepID=A0A327VWR1_9BACT|nr:AAA family ATPase [Chitinophaga dinghuensis]RAJ80379.1 putative ATP-dependent endonuclease of OLD family [Chitinophaga dinghuensis]
MISAIQFLEPDKVLDDYYLGDEPLKTLPSLSKINFFVGANNSGKSRLLRRLLLKLKDYRNGNSHFSTISSGEYDIIALNQMKRADFIKAVKTDFQELKLWGKRNSSVELTTFLPEDEVLHEYQIWNWLKMQCEKLDLSTSMIIRGEEVERMCRRINDLMEVPLDGKIWTTYIPVHRSVKRFMSPKSDAKKSTTSYNPQDFEAIPYGLLQDRCILDYFVRSIESYDQQGSSHKEKAQMLYYSLYPKENIFTGEQLFTLIQELRNSGEARRKILLDYETFLSVNFFNGEPVEINAIKTGYFEELHVKIGTQPEFPIHELGDGIKAIIVLTFPLFYYRGESRHVIVYEEPELNLHPGLERLFIKTLLMFDNVQVFISTHSNHLLDISSEMPEDISIFSVERKQTAAGTSRFELTNLSSPDAPLLDLLGIRNSSIFLSNCSIWIEGISDRIYLRKFLEVYAKSLPAGSRNFLEDLHFSYFEFGGNNITHFTFDANCIDDQRIKATKLSNRILLVHDLDIGKESRHQLLAKELGDNYYCLDVTEMENLISPIILQEVLQDCRKSRTKDLDVADLKHADYYQQPFCHYVSDLLKGDVSNLKKIFSKPSKSRTSVLYNKADFARIVVSKIKCYDDLSQPAKALTESIHAFILKHNSN